MIWLGSLGLPRKGSGDKYGASVSTKILSAGIDLNVFANSFDFLQYSLSLLAYIHVAEKNKKYNLTLKL